MAGWPAAGEARLLARVAPEATRSHPVAAPMSSTDTQASLRTTPRQFQSRFLSMRASGCIAMPLAGPCRP